MIQIRCISVFKNQNLSEEKQVMIMSSTYKRNSYNKYDSYTWDKKNA